METKCGWIVALGSSVRYANLKVNVGQGWKPAKHSGVCRLHNIVSEPCLSLVLKFHCKNTQFYSANLLNNHGELFFYLEMKDFCVFTF